MSSASPPSDERERRKRVRNWTAQDRQKHKSIEASRRQAFNERLLTLARLLPALHDECKDGKVPSKHIVVDESARELERLRDEVVRLRGEVATLRQMPSVARAVLPDAGSALGFDLQQPTAGGIEIDAALLPQNIGSYEQLAADNMVLPHVGFDTPTAEQLQLWELTMADTDILDDSAVPVPTSGTLQTGGNFQGPFVTNFM